MSSQETHDVSTQHVAECSTSGRVKWFNNKAGYGFITVTSKEHNGEDVFVHHTAIQVKQEQYRYLVQGEYVNFKLCEVEDAQHKWQAGDVHGIDNGKLMCETRLESRENRTNRREVSGESDAVRRRSATGEGERYRVRTPRGPREGEEWMLVRTRRPGQHARAPMSQPSGQETLRGRTNDKKYRDDGN
tara:strand:- start:1167 stop:1730 length:564 start_codon:yes stop_codon:yes gene_type:complete